MASETVRANIVGGQTRNEGFNIARVTSSPIGTDSAGTLVPNFSSSTNAVGGTTSTTNANISSTATNRFVGPVVQKRAEKSTASRQTWQTAGYVLIGLFVALLLISIVVYFIIWMVRRRRAAQRVTFDRQQVVETTNIQEPASLY